MALKGVTGHVKPDMPIRAARHAVQPQNPDRLLLLQDYKLFRGLLLLLMHSRPLSAVSMPPTLYILALNGVTGHVKPNMAIRVHGYKG